MKHFRRGLALAALALAAPLLAAPAASADPIGAPWTGTGRVSIRGTLHGITCDLAVAGARDGNAITTAGFSNCSAGYGAITALTPWAVTWNGTNTGGTIAVAYLAVIIGLSCLHAGTVNFTYSASVFTFTTSTLNRVSGSGPFCDAQNVFAGVAVVN